jgi:dTDP-glucose 4,6-dehydratase
MSFEPHNVCITGGAGFIGANFVRYWLGRGGAGRVVVLDALTYAGNLENLRGLDRDARYEFVRGDICDESVVRELLASRRIDTLVHFAAESHVDRSILGPDDFIRTNVVGTHALLKAAKALWIDQQIVPGHRFHHVSTDEVYGSLAPSDPPFHEATPYAPNSPYSASKAASDHLVRAYHETYGLDTTVTNSSNNYGPYQFPEKLIPLTLTNILEGKRLPVYGDGLQTRDWLYVADHCEAIALTLTRGRSGEMYNVGGNSEMTNIEVVRTVCRLTDELLAASGQLKSAFPSSPAAHGCPADHLIQYVRDRPGHDRRYAVDYRKAAREIGYTPRHSLAKGLRDTLEWYLSNRGWWEALKGRDFAAWVDKNYRQH